MILVFIFGYSFDFRTKERWLNSAESSPMSPFIARRHGNARAGNSDLSALASGAYPLPGSGRSGEVEVSTALFWCLLHLRVLIMQIMSIEPGTARIPTQYPAPRTPIQSPPDDSLEDDPSIILC